MYTQDKEIARDSRRLWTAVIVAFFLALFIAIFLRENRGLSRLSLILITVFIEVTVFWYLLHKASKALRRGASPESLLKK